MRNRERRIALFDLFAANFQHFVPDAVGVCVCPIFYMGCRRNVVEFEPLGMDLAHIYPEACGGTQKAAVLTCRKCNNRVGTKYDPHLALDHKNMAALCGQGRGSVDGRLGFNGGTIGVSITSDENGYQLKEIAKQTNPAISQQFRQLPPLGGQITFTLCFDEPDSRRLSVSLLHCAYLSLFRYFGYEYCIFGNSKCIRDVLEQVDPPKLVPYISLDLDPSNVQQFGSMNSVYFMPFAAKVDSETYCLAVPLPSPDDRIGARLILLPGFGAKEGETYRRFYASFESETPIALRLATRLDVEDEREQRLRESRSVTHGREWWQNHRRFLGSL